HDALPILATAAAALIEISPAFSASTTSGAAWVWMRSIIATWLALSLASRASSARLTGTGSHGGRSSCPALAFRASAASAASASAASAARSEEHTSELQSRENLVCRLLLEKKKKTAPASDRPS